MTGPAEDARHPKTSFQHSAFTLRKGSLTSIRPRESFRAIIRSKYDNRIIVHSEVFDFLHHNTNIVIELGHAGFLFRPSVLCIAHGFIFGGEMCDNMHACWV